MEDYFHDKIIESQEVFEKISKDRELINSLIKITQICCGCIEKGGKIIFAGNGGSAADAQHFAAELMIRFEKERNSIASIALNSDSSLITACANDFGYDEIFKRQLEGLARKNDVFIAISTSGKSQNIVKALEFTKKNEILSILFTGANQSNVEKNCDYVIKIPSKNTARIQEGHTLIGHILCGMIEKNLQLK